MKKLAPRLLAWVAAGALALGCSGDPPSDGPDAASGDLDGGGSLLGDVVDRPDGSAGCTGAACDDGGGVPAVCGDKTIGTGEQCDDGNSRPGDGCSGVCSVEPGYTCPKAGEPCVYTVTQTCGNGAIEGLEICDDGNKNDGDGCSAGCQIEPGWTCAKPNQPCTPTVTAVCGDGAVSSGEQCDDKNTSPGDGCDASCKLESGWICKTPGLPCTKLEYCGDGIKNLAEECDDGNSAPGDGCTGVCKTEPGYACPAQGLPCVRIWVCGNARVDPGEACDDGNTASTDGCAADCSLVEPGWTCPPTGGPCAKAPPNTCGDGVLAGAEQCDDGNTAAGDGCTTGCAVEAGYTCPTPGAKCKKIAFCGDGNVDLLLGEECDDKNAASGDGCSALCKLEPNFVCLTPGQPCTSTVKCGDQKIGGSETCDDGNAVSFDGCSSTCQTEAGWTCPYLGARCIAKSCGDGVVAGTEQCDDGNATAGDGCTACKRDPGFACTIVSGKSVCKATTCGDTIVEGSEQCDDGNSLPFDGCFNCQKEPSCPGGVCAAVCGDGQRFAGEECDDGNTIDFDGCSSTCKVEQGFTCTDVTSTPPATIKLPVLLRDFIGRDNQLGGATYHPDFNRHGGVGIVGIVTNTLSADGRPVLNCPSNDCTLNPGHLYENPPGTPNISTRANFDQWYRDDAVNLKSAITITLDRNAVTGNYVWDSANLGQNGGIDFFNPIGSGGWVAAGRERLTALAECNPRRNSSFTSETHFWFEYQGGERFDFSGDDDTWVYLNSRLAVDLGGLHVARNGYFQLAADPDGAGPLKPSGRGTTFQDITSVTQDVDFGLVQGGVYEVVMFQAERNQCGSNFKVTLKNFARPKSACVSTCGDGKVASDEVCDDGINDGRYNGCMPGCKARGPFCGDSSVTTPPEACDNGVNASTYGGASSTACGPGCAFAPYCGDAIVSNGEECDEGKAKNGSGYGACSAGCTLGPRCGDGIVNGPETCDQGPANGSSGSPCKADCTKKCGDGVLQPGEQCDRGAASNTGGYGGCNPDCTLGPRCGDGFKNGSEACDDGKNDGSYGTCTASCTLAPYCGDGTATNPPEKCDLGAANSSTAYGRGTCTKQCVVGPYCGDKAVDGAFGETCDDGVNDGKPGSCTADCKSAVQLVSCGNGRIDAGEACDDGINNGTLNSRCDTRCHLKCGNGFRDAGEECDDGKNDGSYGTCNANCTLAGYCGDNIKNGPEECDFGVGNAPLASAYGPGLCTIACKFAPYCGDGRVQASFGEECDGTASCTPACKDFVPK